MASAAALDDVSVRPEAVATVREGVEVGRRERQCEEIKSALAGGCYARVLVLSREHLAEFPNDVDVRSAADEARRRQGQEASSGET